MSADEISSEDRTFVLAVALFFAILGLLAALTAGPDIVRFVGVVLSWFGAAEKAPLPANGRFSEGAAVMVLLALTVAHPTLKLVLWSAGDSRIGIIPVERRAAALGAVSALFLLFGLGVTAAYQFAMGWPIHLTAAAALSGLPLAVIAVVVVVVMAMLEE